MATGAMFQKVSFDFSTTGNLQTALDRLVCPVLPRRVDQDLDNCHIFRIYPIGALSQPRIKYSGTSAQSSTIGIVIVVKGKPSMKTLGIIEYNLRYSTKGNFGLKDVSVVYASVADRGGGRSLQE